MSVGVRASSKTHVHRVEFQSLAKCPAPKRFLSRLAQPVRNRRVAALVSRPTRNLSGSRFLIANPPRCYLGSPMDNSLGISVKCDLMLLKFLSGVLVRTTSHSVHRPCFRDVNPLDTTPHEH